MMAPASAGPTMQENWNMAAFQFTAREKTFRSTSAGRKAALAAHENVRAMPPTNRQTYIQYTGAWRAETKAMPRLAAAMTAAIQTMIRLRLKLSARCPAGSVNRNIGIIN